MIFGHFRVRKCVSHQVTQLLWANLFLVRTLVITSNFSHTIKKNLACRKSPKYKVLFYWTFKAFLAFLLQHPHFTGVMTEIHWHSTGNFDEDLKAYFGHLHDRNSWYKHKVEKYLGKKGMDLFHNVQCIGWIPGLGKGIKFSVKSSDFRSIFEITWVACSYAWVFHSQNHWIYLSFNGGQYVILS